MIGLGVLLIICFMVIWTLANDKVEMSQRFLDLENQRNSAMGELSSITGKNYYFDDNNRIKEWD